jgi:hypothetical protein
MLTSSPDSIKVHATDASVRSWLGRKVACIQTFRSGALNGGFQQLSYPERGIFPIEISQRMSPAGKAPRTRLKPRHGRQYRHHRGAR